MIHQGHASYKGRAAPYAWQFSKSSIIETAFSSSARLVLHIVLGWYRILSCQEIDLTPKTTVKLMKVSKAALDSSPSRRF